MMGAWTYQQILDTADQLYPNGLTTDFKLRLIGDIEAKLFRTIYRQKRAYREDIVAGQFLYPIGFSKSKIIWVIVDGRRYEYEEIDNDEGQPPFLYTYDGALGLYPTPERDVPGGLFVFHWYEPTAPTLGGVMQFDPDFPMALVYGLCAQMAKSAREFNVASGFVIDYNNEVEQFKRSKQEPQLNGWRVV